MFNPVNIKTTSVVDAEDDLIQRALAKDTVDLKADEIRKTYPAKGESVTQEYELVASEVLSYRGNTSVIPQSLQDYADVSGLTVAQCADIIEQTEADFNTALLAIRKKRLEGAKAIEDDSTGDYLTVIQPYIDALELLRKPV